MIDGSLNFYEFLDQNRIKIVKENKENMPKRAYAYIPDDLIFRRQQSKQATMSEIMQISLSMPLPRIVLAEKIENMAGNARDLASIFNPFACISYLGDKSIRNNSESREKMREDFCTQSFPKSNSSAEVIIVESYEDNHSEREVLLLNKKRERDENNEEEKEKELTSASESNNNTPVNPLSQTNSSLSTTSSTTKATRRRKKNKVERANELFQDSFLKNSLDFQNLKVEIEAKTENKSEAVYYPNYSLDDYYTDLKLVEGTYSHDFMKNHFPSLYSYDNFYKFVKKRMDVINQSSMLNSDVESKLEKFEENNNTDRELNSKPKKIWSPQAHLDSDEISILDVIEQTKSLSFYNPNLHKEEYLLEFLLNHQHYTTQHLLTLLQSNDLDLHSFLQSKFNSYTILEQSVNKKKRVYFINARKNQCK